MLAWPDDDFPGSAGARDRWNCTGWALICTSRSCKGNKRPYNPYSPHEHVWTHLNMSEHTSDLRTHTNLLWRPLKDFHAPLAIFSQFASIWDDPHQYGDHLYIFYINPEQHNLNGDCFGLHNHTGLVNSLGPCKRNLREFSLVFPCKVWVFPFVLV
jgi:hypothetical protein